MRFGSHGPCWASLEAENFRGGEAREVVLAAAKAMDIDLHENILDGDLWSPANMQRILQGVENMRYELARYKGTLHYHKPSVQVGQTEREETH